MLNSKNLTIYIGYDPKEAAAFHTAVQSLIEHATQPLKIVPVSLKNFKAIYNRKHDVRQSNEFSFSRFLVPHINNYEGYAIFMDCDMMLTRDIYSLADEIQDFDKAVWLVKHDYKSSADIKYLGNVQYHYPRKNWSSFVLWNCAHKKNHSVTEEFVRDADAATLHRFLWLDDHEIGSLPLEWNFLVGEYSKPSVLPANIHWTLGGPYFYEYAQADYHEMWNEMFQKATFTQQNDK